MGKGIRAPHLPVYIYLCTRVRFCPELLLRVCPFLLAWVSLPACVCVCGLAVYPCFKASVSLMRLCCKRSSLGLLTCSAFQTSSTLSPPSHTHTHPSSQVNVCVVPKHWLVDFRQWRTTFLKLCAASQLLFPCTRSFSRLFSSLLRLSPQHSLTSCLCISLCRALHQSCSVKGPFPIFSLLSLPCLFFRCKGTGIWII